MESANRYKNAYTGKILELTAYYGAMVSNQPRKEMNTDGKFKRLQQEVDAAHKQWFAHRHGHSTEKEPAKTRRQSTEDVNKCSEYERILIELLTATGRETISGQVHLQPCWLCGEIILGIGDKKETLKEHMHYMHWTS